MILTTIGRPARLLLVSFCALLIIGGLGGLAGCGGERPGEGEAKPGASAPHRGGSVVTGWIAEPGGVNELLAHSTQPTSELLFRLFLHLVEEQPDFTEHPATFAPMLAKSYDWSPDHKTLTFHLREDALWSDGVPVTADDVRWTWQAQTDPAVAWDSAFMKREIRDVRVIDPHTVRFLFDHAYAKQLLDVNEGVILPRHVWSRIPFAKWHESSEWFAQHLVVDGPFTIASWKPQQEVMLARNPRYYRRDRPYLDRVAMRIVPDTGAAIAQLLGGEIDFFAQIPPNQAAKIKSAPNLRLIAYWSNLYVMVAWNDADPLFADPAVRRALTLAIDRQTIVESVLGPYGRVAVSPIITSVWAHDRSLKPLPYDPAEAKRILAAKGWRDSDGDGVLDRNGKPFAFEISSNAGNQQRNDAAVMIQDQLKKVGIRATPRVLEFNALVTQTRSGNFQATVTGFSLDTSLDLTANFHSRSIADGSNFFHYANPEVDRLIDRINGQTDLVAARPDLDRLQRLIYGDQPMTFLWESQRLAPVNRRVHDARPNLLSAMFNVQDWWVEPAGGSAAGR